MKREFLFIVGLLLLLGQGSKAKADCEFASTPSGPAPILDVQWRHVDFTGEKTKRFLRVEIENVSDSPWTVDVSLECMGLIQHSAELDLGVVEIAAGEVVRLKIDAADLPLQSLDYIMQARVNAEVELERPRMNVIRPTYSEHLFYRHAGHKLKKVHTFSEEILSLVYDGRLAPEEPPQGEIGWVMGEQGVLEPVYATDFAFLDDNEGVIAYYYGATGIHSGKEGGIGDTIPYEPTPPYSTAEMKFCANWFTGYIDAGFGEDYLALFSMWYWYQHLVPASYARVMILYKNTNQQIWHGYLDEDGCTPYLVVESSTKYRILQWTDMEKDSGTSSEKKIAVLRHAANAWHANWAEMIATELYTVGLVDGSQNTVDIAPALFTRGSNVAPVAALVLENADKMAYPDGMETYISTRFDEEENFLECTSTHYCLTPSGQPSNNICLVFDRPYWKYVIAQEIGHRVGYGQDAWKVGSYDINNDEDDVYSTNYHCNCDHIDPESNNGKGQWHCLQSREHIKTAQGEAWAHAYATMLFNDRGWPFWMDATFVNYKIGNDGFIVQPPFYVDAKDTIKRMETYCDDEMTDKGTEQDWLVFLTNVWQDNVNRFSAEELIAISDFAVYDSYWSDLVYSVGVLHVGDFAKISHFNTKGDEAGVDH